MGGWPSLQRALPLPLLRQYLPAATSRAALVGWSRPPWRVPTAESRFLRRSALRMTASVRDPHGGFAFPAALDPAPAFERAPAVEYAFQVTKLLMPFVVACAGKRREEGTRRVDPPARENCPRSPPTVRPAQTGTRDCPLIPTSLLFHGGRGERSSSPGSAVLPPGAPRSPRSILDSLVKSEDGDDWRG